MELKKAVDAMYYHLALAELRRMSKKATLPNITYNSLLYLDLIEMTPECTASMLAGILHISKPAVTAKVGELIKQGLVEKKQSEKDKRVYYLTVHPDAMEEYRDFDAVLNQASKSVQQQYSPEQVRIFCSILGDFCQAFKNEVNHA